MQEETLLTIMAGSVWSTLMTCVIWNTASFSRSGIHKWYRLEDVSIFNNKKKTSLFQHLCVSRCLLPNLRVSNILLNFWNWILIWIEVKVKSVNCCSKCYHRQYRCIDGTAHLICAKERLEERGRIWTLVFLTVQWSNKASEWSWEMIL